jgi:outer membrane biosynthesis protein TonB
MSNPRFIRGFVAIAAIATVLSAAYRSSAAELNRLVVTGLALGSVASRHSIPDYPQDARTFRIQGEVRVRIEVEKGKTINVTAESGSPMLGNYSARWVRWRWHFRPTVSGIYILPISYKLTA